jgi:hypothetical protein
VDGCLSIQYRLERPACTSAHASTTPLQIKKKEKEREELDSEQPQDGRLIPFSQSEQASERAWGKIYKKKE